MVSWEWSTAGQRSPDGVWWRHDAGTSVFHPDKDADRDEVPADNPDPVLSISDTGPGTTHILAGLRPYVHGAYLGSPNLEAVVTAAALMVRAASARAMRLLLWSAPPRRGDGVVQFDNVGLVGWR